MPTTVTSEWTDCFKWLPYRDYLGHLRLIPKYTQRRRVMVDGKAQWEYREREETFDEYLGRQY